MIQRKKIRNGCTVGVHAQNDNEFNFESTMEELEALSETCQLNVKVKSLKTVNKLITNTMLVKVKLKKFKLYRIP